MPFAAAFLSICLALGAATSLFGAETRDEASSVPGVRVLEAPGIHNLFAAGTNVFSGSVPEGDEAFAALARMGVKTAISVDGAQPDVELARKYGIRYVHFPHGYDGIATNLQLQLAKAAEALPGPIYVHCHHGKHRGPAAAAIICMAQEGWTPARAEAWLKAAGTSTNYAGLYQTVREFHRPGAAELRGVPAEFPERAKVSGLVDAMVKVDEVWERLKNVRAAGYLASNEHPDIVPASETVMLWEHYREAQRLPDVISHGADFVRRFHQAETEAREAEKLLRAHAAQPGAETRARLDQSFDTMAKTCSACHKTFRDPAGIKAKQ